MTGISDRAICKVGVSYRAVCMIAISYRAICKVGIRDVSNARLVPVFLVLLKEVRMLR